ncbi:MAG: DUF222 domain-containing protein [Acidimicrobiia bacterium]
MADGESIQVLCRELERLQAIATRAVAAFDAGREWEEDGARSAAAWLATRCRRTVTSARRQVKIGRVLRELPVVEAAWVDGDIGGEHVEPMAATCRRVGLEIMRPDEAFLVDKARELGVRPFRQVLAYWEQAVDPDGVEDTAEAQRESRRLHLSQSYEGMWFLDGLLDPVSGEIVSNALRAIEGERYDPARTPAQRRADALVEMARRAAAADGATARPLFTVLVGYETLAGRVCELASGTVVTPGSLLPWLTEAHVERVVFDGPDRVKNVGPRRRLFDGATRRAVEVRDRKCYSEFCDVPADECQVDHVRPWSQGGPTIDSNGRAACGYHNRFRHPRPP